MANRLKRIGAEEECRSSLPPKGHTALRLAIVLDDAVAAECETCEDVGHLIF